MLNKKDLDLQKEKSTMFSSVEAFEQFRQDMKHWYDNTLEGQLKRLQVQMKHWDEKTLLGQLKKLQDDMKREHEKTIEGQIEKMLREKAAHEVVIVPRNATVINLGVSNALKNFETEED